MQAIRRSVGWIVMLSLVLEVFGTGIATAQEQGATDACMVEGACSAEEIFNTGVDAAITVYNKTQVPTPVSGDVSDDIILLSSQSIPADTVLAVKELSGAALASALAEVDTSQFQARSAAAFQADGASGNAAEVVTDSEAGVVAAASGSGAGPVVHSWKSREDWNVRYRANRIKHVKEKHRLSNRTVRRVTQLAWGLQEEPGGYTWRYETYATEWECWYRWGFWPTCRVRRQQKVRVVVSYRVLRDGYYFGVVTAYCPGVQGFCPAWVNKHIN